MTGYCPSSIVSVHIDTIHNATEIEGESVTGYRVSSIVSVHIDTIHKQRYKKRERA